MCKAEENYIFVVNHVEGFKPILKVQCTSNEVIVDKAKSSILELSTSNLCYTFQENSTLLLVIGKIILSKPYIVKRVGKLGGKRRGGGYYMGFPWVVFIQRT